MVEFVRIILRGLEGRAKTSRRNTTGKNIKGLDIWSENSQCVPRVAKAGLTRLAKTSRLYGTKGYPKVGLGWFLKNENPNVT